MHDEMRSIKLEILAFHKEFSFHDSKIAIAVLSSKAWA